MSTADSAEGQGADASARPANPSGRTDVVPPVVTPATVDTAQAIADERAAVDRIDAMAGTATVRHEPLELVDRTAARERIRREGEALDRARELAVEHPPQPFPAIDLTVAVPDGLHRRLVDEARRLGLPPASLVLDALERLLR